jgi:hypothetical protein
VAHGSYINHFRGLSLLWTYSDHLVKRVAIP